MGRLLARRTARLTEAEDTVRPILEAVRTRGDKGLLEYARKFDQLERKSVRVPPHELAAAATRLTPEFRSAVEVAVRQRPALRRKAIAARIHRLVRRQACDWARSSAHWTPSAPISPRAVIRCLPR